MSEPISYLIFDVDDVIVDTDKAEGRAREELRRALSDLFAPALARRIYEEFFRVWDLVVDWQQGGLSPDDPRFAETLDRLCYWQRGVTEAGHEMKIWSREAMLAAALEVNGIEPSKRFVNQPVMHYWTALGDHSEVFADAAAALDALEAASVRVHLATNSDGKLSFNNRRNTLIYDPALAEAEKRLRLSCLAELGFTRHQLTVGDPIGKGDARFCHETLRDFAASIGEEVDLSRTTVVGDSLGSDILPFLEIGVAHGLWLRRDSERGRRSRQTAPANVTVIRSLGELMPLL